MSARVKDVMTTRVVAVRKDATFKFGVSVSSGVVTLEGQPETAARGREIVAETWHVEGVVAVRDRLSYPEGQ
jgi:osmotically-inducible protein OsmY